MMSLQDFLKASSVLLTICAMGILASCSTSSKLNRNLKTINQAIEASPALRSGFTGLYVADVSTGEVLISVNADKYFTPASNVKILTLYGCLQTLKDSLTAFRYVETDTSLILWGAADPSFLHPWFDSENTLNFLKDRADQKAVVLSYGHSGQLPYGEGWMWDDYNDYYQAELTSFPAFGNILLLKKEGTDQITSPAGFTEFFKKDNSVKRIRRSSEKNEFLIPAKLDTVKAFYQEVPYRNAESVNASLLAKLTSADVQTALLTVPEKAITLHSVALDTVLRRMMVVSDNMLAEHLLLQCGFVSGDTISTHWTINHLMKDPLLKDVKPYWVDGSGLSRYNRLTPVSLCKVLSSLYKIIPEKRLFSMFPAGGSNGTIKSMFTDTNDSPYVYAKTGSMTGVYNLSGFLTAKSGRKLVFSIMNNQFDATVAEARNATEKIVSTVRQLY
mgnify:CR=1 FL=1